MQRPVFLLGVDHRFQRVGTLGLPPEVTAEFAAALKSLVPAHHIQGIAEEMSIDGLGMHKSAGGSVPFFVAAELGLSHRYCDPSRETQRQLGIDSGTQRERYWLRELDSFTAYPCLFVLGATHITSFSSLLAEAGFAPSVVFDDWRPSIPLEEV